jgi:hypothetical protein
VRQDAGVPTELLQLEGPQHPRDPVARSVRGGEVLTVDVESLGVLGPKDAFAEPSLEERADFSVTRRRVSAL